MTLPNGTEELTQKFIAELCLRLLWARKAIKKSYESTFDVGNRPEAALSAIVLSMKRGMLVISIIMALFVWIAIPDSHGDQLGAAPKNEPRLKRGDVMCIAEKPPYPDRKPSSLDAFETIELTQQAMVNTTLSRTAPWQYQKCLRILDGGREKRIDFRKVWVLREERDLPSYVQVRRKPPSVDYDYEAGQYREISLKETEERYTGSRWRKVWVLRRALVPCDSRSD